MADKWEDGLNIFGTVVSIVGLVGFGAGFVQTFVEGLQYLLNPEFFALQKILELFK